MTTQDRVIINRLPTGVCGLDEVVGRQNLTRARIGDADDVLVVQLRMKRPGMRWSPHGGQAMLALCARVASRRPLPAYALVATPQRRAA